MENSATDPVFGIASDVGTVIDAVSHRFRLREEPVVSTVQTYLDSFDWRIYKNGGSLIQSTDERGSVLLWQNLDGSPRYRLACSRAPVFADDLPDSLLARALRPVLEMRALLPVAGLEMTGRTLRILNADEKTVVRLRFEKPTLCTTEHSDLGGQSDLEGNGPGLDLLIPRLRVLPVRGYDKAFHSALAFLRDDLGLVPAPLDPVDFLATGGRRPGGYSSKVRLELTPGAPAAEATVAIHQTLLQAIRVNENGVRRDLDSEFLHDFRVAVRRTRSALGQIKGVLPAAAVTYFKREFKWLGGLTGPTRDLDVYLLKFGDYKKGLPTSVQPDLEPLRAFLIRRQRREQRRLVAGLDDGRYARLLDDWSAFLDGADSGPWTAGSTDEERPDHAERPIGDVAARRIWKVFRRVLRLGGAIDDDTPDQALHDLRIECKKLRYLMEFFRSLFEAAEIGRLIKALKRLQDNLGDFNDYVVQQEHLRRFAREMQEEGTATPETLMAMGRLVERLEEGHSRERRRFHSQFSKFADDENCERARALFT